MSKLSGGGSDVNQSDLVGRWVHIIGATMDKPKNVELFKDGTGIIDKKIVAWKVENERLVLLFSFEGEGIACDYKLSDYELNLSYDDGGSAVFAKKEKLEEVKAKRAANQIKQLEQQFVQVKGGTFTRDENNVTVGDFYICKYEVTQELWEAVMGNNPSNFTGSENLPVENVSWDDAQEFIRKLNLMTGKKYRLPTEAEWEFAARGGNNSKGYEYSGSGDMDQVAWYNGNSGGRTQPVGKKKPNELGIYDMSGNVWEWCSDWYGDYPSGSVTNPKGPDSGSSRVFRGGSWSGYSQDCRVAYRYGNSPSFRDYDLGLRVAFNSY